MIEHPTDTSAALPAAVLWDFDGTLIDTEPIWIAQEYAVAEQLGGHWNDDLAHANIGNSLLNTGAALRHAAGRDDLTDAQVTDLLVAKVVAQLREAELVWRPGVAELLDELTAAGVACALVSASFRELLNVVLERLDRHPFEVVIAGDEVTHGKPHPEPYLTACARLGVTPRDCLVVEDSTTGAASGNAAGCVVVVVPNVVTPPPAPRRVRLESLAGVGLNDLRALMVRAGAR